MSSDHVLESPLPGTLDAMPVVDDPVISDSLLHQVMDEHDAEQAAAEQQFQNLQLQSESGSQENDTEAAILYQHGPENPATPIDLTMDDSEYAPIDEGEEDYSSGDSVEVIQETQVQEEEVQSTHLAPLEASQMLESHQESAAAPVRDPSEDLGDADIDAEIERMQQEIRHLQQRKAARRARQDQGPEPRNVRARVSPEQERRAPRPRPRQRQGTIEAFVRNDGNVQGARTPDPGREPVMQRRLSAHPERVDIPLPQNEQELYEQWLITADTIIPEHASVYSDFRQAFGDETDEGRQFREDEIKAIAKVLFDFVRTSQPGQHAMLKGREREGKTGALFSIALAALIMRMRVVILCAPNKVAPVVDM